MRNGGNGSVELQLASGFTAAIFRDSKVETGDTLTARMVIAGQKGNRVRIMIYRHCPGEFEEGSEALNLDLTGDPQLVEISHKFEHSYECVRVSYQPITSEPLNVTVQNLSLVSE
jgi:hypothetical protein